MTVESNRIETEKPNENVSDTSKKNTEKLQNGSILLGEDAEAKKSRVQNTVLIEDFASQNEGKEIDAVETKTNVDHKKENDFANESVIENTQKLRPEPESSNADLTEAIRKESEKGEEKCVGKDFQENEAGEEKKVERTEEVKGLQDSICEKSGLVESEIPRSEAIIGAGESQVKNTDDLGKGVQEEIKMDPSNAPETAGKSLDSDADEMLESMQKSTDNIAEEAQEKCSSEPTPNKDEGQAIDPVQELVETSMGRATEVKETDINVSAGMEDKEKQSEECDNQHTEEKSTTEESDIGHQTGDHKLEKAEENHNADIQIDTDLPVVSSDVKSDTVIKQPRANELSPVPNISISCVENEAKDKLGIQCSVENSRHLDHEDSKENDTDSGTGSTADNSSIDLNLSISSFLTKNKDSGSMSLQVRVINLGF